MTAKWRQWCFEHLILFFLQVLTFNAPLTLILGTTLDLRRQQVCSTHVPAGMQRMAKWRVIMSDIPFSLLLLFQTYIALTEFPANYGTTAMIASPVRGGSVLVAILLLYFVHVAPVKRMCAINGHVGNDLWRHWCRCKGWHHVSPLILLNILLASIWSSSTSSIRIIFFFLMNATCTTQQEWRVTRSWIKVMVN